MISGDDGSQPPSLSIRSRGQGGGRKHANRRKQGRNALTLETASHQGVPQFAQVTAWVGERTHNPSVGGSSPPRPTVCPRSGAISAEALHSLLPACYPTFERSHSNGHSNGHLRTSPHGYPHEHGWQHLRKVPHQQVRGFECGLDHPGRPQGDSRASSIGRRPFVPVSDTAPAAPPIPLARRSSMACSRW